MSVSRTFPEIFSVN